MEYSRFDIGNVGIVNDNTNNSLWLTRLSVFNLYSLQTSHQFYLKFTSNSSIDTTFTTLLNERYKSIQNQVPQWKLETNTVSYQGTGYHIPTVLTIENPTITITFLETKTFDIYKTQKKYLIVDKNISNTNRLLDNKYIIHKPTYYFEKLDVTLFSQKRNSSNDILPYLTITFYNLYITNVSVDNQPDISNTELVHTTIEFGYTQVFLTPND